MKTGRKRWRPPPPVVVLTTAIILIAGMMLLGWLNARRYRVNALVEIADPAVSTDVMISPASLNIPGLPDGEVARMAVRVREATGLLMGLTVLALSEQMHNRDPANAEALLSLMTKRNLFPHGISHDLSKAVLESDRATIYIRFRSLPLGIEVLSIGRKMLDGPAVIARLVTGGQDDSAAVLLVAKKIEGVEIPNAFASLTEIAGLNWSIEPLRERAITSQESDELNNWARKYAAGNR
jgi:hypothetical protein